MTYHAIQTARGRPQPRQVSDAQLAEAPAPRQEVAYRCEAGHVFAVVFAAGVAPPLAWDCRCGAGAVLPGTPGGAGWPGLGGEPDAARCHRYMHERRTLVQLEELLAERLAVLAGSRVPAGWLTMTGEEWLEVLASAPAVRQQVAAVHAEFVRLGFTAGERAERLAACAALLGIGGLWSTRDLAMGDAARLVGMLRRVPDRARLDAAVAAGGVELEAGQPAALGVAEALAHAFALAVSGGRAESQDLAGKEAGK